MTVRFPYEALMADGQGEACDRHVFACALVLGQREAGNGRPLTDALGLDRGALCDLLRTHFPHAMALVDGLPDGACAGADALEEGDLRALLLDHAATDDPAAVWLAAIVARRSLEPNHLWQDLGLMSRADLSGLLDRHFRALARRNTGDMKWKKFFYRELCAREGIVACKAPNCAICSDLPHCFAREEGEPLSALQRDVLKSRHTDGRL